jgi:hypothetical protein
MKGYRQQQKGQRRQVFFVLHFSDLQIDGKTIGISDDGIFIGSID